MNWVGGIKRRILLQEEEKRRQEQFFASRASSKAKQKRGRANPSRHIGPGVARQRNEDFIFKRLQMPSTTSHQQDMIMEEEVEEPESQSLSRKGVYINRRLKLSSIHGPFSEVLLKMEYQGAKAKIRRRERSEKKAKQYEVPNNSIDGKKQTFTKMTYSEMMENNLDASTLKSPKDYKNNCSFYNFNSFMSQSKLSSKTSNRKTNLLEGAPKMRKIISLTPNRGNKRAIWTPITMLDEVNPNTDTKELKRKSTGDKSKLEMSKNRLEEAYAINTTYEANLIKKLLGSPESQTSDNEARLHQSHSTDHSEHMDSICISSRDNFDKPEFNPSRPLMPRNLHVIEEKRSETLLHETSFTIRNSRTDIFKLSNKKRNLQIMATEISSLRNPQNKTPYSQNSSMTSRWTPTFSDTTLIYRDQSSGSAFSKPLDKTEMNTEPSSSAITKNLNNLSPIFSQSSSQLSPINKYNVDKMNREPEPVPGISPSNLSTRLDDSEHVPTAESPPSCDRSALSRVSSFLVQDIRSTKIFNIQEKKGQENYCQIDSSLMRLKLSSQTVMEERFSDQ